MCLGCATVRDCPVIPVGLDSVDLPSSLNNASRYKVLVSSVSSQADILQARTVH